jgi:hypothetical protein
MNHIGQLFLFILIIVGIVLIARSRRLARQIKIDAMDQVARIQLDEDLTQIQKDQLVLSWVKALGEMHEMSSLFGDIMVGMIVLIQILMLAVSFTF